MMNRFLSLLVAVLALLLMSMAWPRLQASMTFLPVDTAIGKYYDTLEIPGEQLQGLLGRAVQAAGVHDHYRYRDGMSILHYLQGLADRGSTPGYSQALEQSLAEAVHSLQKAPAQPMVWQRMARIHALLRDGPEKVLPPWKMSIYTGRVEPPLLAGRLELGYLYLPSLDEEARGLLRDQTLLAWRLRPREVLRLLTEGRIILWSVRQILHESDEQVIREMEAAVERAVRKAS